MDIFREKDYIININSLLKIYDFLGLKCDEVYHMVFIYLDKFYPSLDLEAKVSIIEKKIYKNNYYVFKELILYILNKYIDILFDGLSINIYIKELFTKVGSILLKYDIQIVDKIYNRLFYIKENFNSKYLKYIDLHYKINNNYIYNYSFMYKNMNRCITICRLLNKNKIPINYARIYNMHTITKCRLLDLINIGFPINDISLDLLIGLKYTSYTLQYYIDYISILIAHGYINYKNSEVIKSIGIKSEKNNLYNAIKIMTERQMIC